MASHVLQNILRNLTRRTAEPHVRSIHTATPLFKTQAGKYKRTPDKSRAITYEQAYPPPEIKHAKSWNSWNTSTLEGGLRMAEIAVDDLFIRKFMYGTFPTMLASEVIIKRQHNIIRIAAIVVRKEPPTKFAFLIGYTEELLSYWLHCPVKLELVFINDPKEVVYRYV